MCKQDKKYPPKYVVLGIRMCGCIIKVVILYIILGGTF